MPRARRAFALLLLLDLLVGIWMRLHAERWLTFFVTHLPVLGVAAAAWTLATDDARSWLRDRLRTLLGHRAALLGLLALVGGLGALSLLHSTVQVASVEPAARTRLRVVAGDRTAADSTRFRAAASQALNRLTSPVAFGIWLPPTGRRVWVHAPGFVSAGRLVLPWIPTRLQFPDDFEALATVAVLPAPALLGLAGDATAPMVLTLRDGADGATVLGTAPLSGVTAVLFGFPEPAAPDSATLAAWRERLRGYLTDPTPAADSAEAAQRRADVEQDVDGTLRRWVGAARRPSGRPVVVGDLLRWELHRGGALVRSDTARVTRAITSIFIEP